MLKNGPVAKLYTGNMREQEMLKNFVLSQRVGKITIYTVKQQRISAAEKKSKGTIQKPSETNENRVAYLVD